jgi:alanyl-tRNA synthetase
MGRDSFAVKVGGAAQRLGLRAGEVARSAAQLMGGRGGGRADFGRGGIKDLAQRDNALTLIRETVSRHAHAGDA